MTTICSTALAHLHGQNISIFNQWKGDQFEGIVRTNYWVATHGRAFIFTDKLAYAWLHLYIHSMSHYF